LAKDSKYQFNGMHEIGPLWSSATAVCGNFLKYKICGQD